jgi:hypothetical protein
MRNASTPVRLLLFALLLIGTVGMHTIGHPPEAKAATPAAAPAAAPAVMTDAAASAAAMPAAPDAVSADPGDCPSGHCSSPAGLPTAHSPAGQGGHGAPGSDHGSSGGMDPMSLCLAIALAAFVLAVTWFALRRGTRRRTTAVRGLWGRLGSALPPPRPPDLSRLAVLRI